MDPTHETPADVAGEQSRDEHPPEKAGPVAPAPPLHSGRDVNDRDDLETTTGKLLGDPLDRPLTPER